MCNYLGCDLIRKKDVYAIKEHIDICIKHDSLFYEEDFVPVKDLELVYVRNQFERFRHQWGNIDTKNNSEMNTIIDELLYMTLEAIRFGLI